MAGIAHCMDLVIFREAVEAVSALDPPADTDVWLGGGMIWVRHELQTSVVFSREQALHEVDELSLFSGVRSITVDWNPNRDDTGIHVELDCLRGVLTTQPAPY